MARKRGSRFRKASDAQAQFEEIDALQRRVRKGKRHGKIVDSVQKSKQRDRNARKGIRKPDDAREEYG